jgi:hypothetical protein
MSCILCIVGETQIYTYMYMYLDVLAVPKDKKKYLGRTFKEI